MRTIYQMMHDICSGAPSVQVRNVMYKNRYSCGLKHLNCAHNLATYLRIRSTCKVMNDRWVLRIPIRNGDACYRAHFTCVWRPDTERNECAHAEHTLDHSTMRNKLARAPKHLKWIGYCTSGPCTCIQLLIQKHINDIFVYRVHQSAFAHCTRTHTRWSIAFYDDRCMTCLWSVLLWPPERRRPVQSPILWRVCIMYAHAR